uniref:NADH-plastoquinone oxidoreductase subunit 5 n=1 Tax=Cycas zeylanica TaxID=933404 RepID=UPI00207AC803|nr:NADH-plastoquinone oxidoreductase subunit 5 [Cycas zeylanica]YP_010411095.1 NADH-plastoquinone oxidoreductase subunit 5 [Cycas sainathii]URF35323.1 NADH-plastoquinone oxidoreductase subunit 5 [Cycas edentata]URF34975.1 NADH-plastoquinone oxidoreductase subunit 5 [Cycas zeylanica]URF35671.1 NADH-plastoquinone oxidoreductase subunit 5 [Cycas zeylanica]URF36019.1 NADH-plastoquinone oxidoreductase subunit 5 [Cycas edentata]URF36367.1 NADH-plastoquinone oxidoreductase subunit 5 [Cycas edentata]
MELIYKYVWIVPFLPLSASVPIGSGSLLFPRATRGLHHIWALISISLLGIAMLLSFNLFLQQITGGPVYQYLWSWTINKNFSPELGYLIDPLTSIMPISVTTVGIMVMIYSDNYMSHDQGYVRFFAYLSLFNASMLGLVISPNLVQIYIFWELVGMCSYLLIGSWFTRPSAANACQKAFITNRIGDFGLLLGILGFYQITGSFEFRYLLGRSNESIASNEVSSFFATLCAFLLFLGPVAKSAQFPLHVWLPDAMEGPTPISALIHAATMVAAGIFLVARLFPLFKALPFIMNLISWTGGITALLGATMALAQSDLKRGLAYSTMSQSGYMVLALGTGSYRAALFHPITHAYSKALLFLGSGSVIHSMESLVGYCPAESQNMALMGGLSKYMPITGTTFLLGTLSLCGIPPFACFWSKDEIISDSWLYSTILGGIARSVAGFTAFYMSRMYFLAFEGDLRVNLYNDPIPFYSISMWGEKESGTFTETEMGSMPQLPGNKNSSSSEGVFKFSGKMEQFDGKPMEYLVITHPLDKGDPPYPKESDNTMLLPSLALGLFTLFVGSIGVSFVQGEISSDILSQRLTLSMNHFHENHPENWSKFFVDAIPSVGIAFFSTFVAFVLYGPINFNFSSPYLWYKRDSRLKGIPDRLINVIYNWSYYRGYIDIYYNKIFTMGIRRLAELTYLFDRWVIDGIIDRVGILGLFVGEGMKYLGGGRTSSYLFGFLFFAVIFLLTIFIFIWIR